MPANAFRLAIMPREGIGTEVMAAARAVLAAVERQFGLSFGADETPGKVYSSQPLHFSTRMDPCLARMCIGPGLRKLISLQQRRL